jgi:hypothetical protein
MELTPGELTPGVTPTVGAMLDRLALAPPLFDDMAIGRLHALSDRLPPARFLLFERHLGPGARRVDLSIGQIADQPEGLDLTAIPAVRGALCLEYDLDGDMAAPALFCTVPLGPLLTEAPLIALATGLLGPLSMAMHQWLARVAAAQGESWITHVGAMLGRPGRPIRINIGASSAASLRRYAETVGCGGESLTALDRLMSIIDGLPLSLILALEFGTALSPRIGIELYMPPPEQAVAALLDRLEAHDLCSAAEATAILAWPDEADADGPPWPEPLRSLDALLGPAERGRAMRSVAHLKLVAECDGSVRAKAYLAAFYVRGDTLRERHP